MSNKLRKKSYFKPAGYTKNEILLMQKRARKNTSDADITAEAFNNIKIISYQILHDKFGFGKKRIVQLDEELNNYLNDYADNKVEAPRDIAKELRAKYKIDTWHEAKVVPLREKILFVSKSIPKNPQDVKNLNNLVEATIFNYFSMICNILKKRFKLSSRQLLDFMDWIRYYINSVVRNYVDILGVASVLACECGFLDQRFEGKVYEV